MTQFKPSMSMPDAAILIVDDSKFARGIISEMLSEAGFTRISEAKDAEEAIRIISTKKPDIAILDIDLGLGGKFDGMKLLKRIKKEKHETKVIIVSALGQKLIEEVVVAEDADAFLVKPFKSEQLLFAIGLAMGYMV